MIKRKSEAFINNRNDQLLAGTNKITANLDMPVQIETRKKRSRRGHERAHGLHRRTLVQPNNYDWPEVPAFTMT